LDSPSVTPIPSPAHELKESHDFTLWIWQPWWRSCKCHFRARLPAAARIHANSNEQWPLGERNHDPDRPGRLDNPKPSNHQQAIELQGVKFPLFSLWMKRIYPIKSNPLRLTSARFQKP
jgi:hypothetical protein